MLGIDLAHRGEKLVGFETGAFHLYIEKDEKHGPVFEFFVLDVQTARQALLASGCALTEEDVNVPCCYIRDLYGLVFNLGQSSA